MNLRGIAIAALISAGAVALSCADDKSTGQLTIVIQTDLAMPKDINYVRLEVRSDGLPLGTDNPPPIHRNDYPINPADPPDLRVTIPATFAVYNAKGAVEPVAVRVTAGRDGQARVLRDAITSVPSDRNAMLRMYVQWLSDGSAKPPPAGTDPRSALNACPDGQTNIAGECVDAHVEVTSLPDYDAQLVFGGSSPATGHGFDVLSCFATTQPVMPDPQCSFDLPLPAFPAGKVNVGFELPAGSDGVCNATHCVVAIDQQESPVGPPLGWFLAGGRVQLPRGVCARLAAVPSAHVVVSRDCASKTAATPICGPSSAVTDCSIAGPKDGSAPPGAIPILGSNAITLGRDHTCGRVTRNAGCWGRNDLFQTGRPGMALVAQNAVQGVQLNADIISISAGVDSTCAVANGVYCWGNNRYGQTGQPLPVPVMNQANATPALVSGDAAAASIVAVSSAGTESHACASGQGRTWCWGANTKQQLGSGGVNGLHAGFNLDSRVLALGDGFSCALNASGSVFCWGDNSAGQLGEVAGGTKPWTPTSSIIGLPPTRDIVAGADFACALTNEDNVWCWGNNASGAVTGMKNPVFLVPTMKPLAGKAKKLAAGIDFVCATLKTTPERLLCWGNNAQGQLGSSQTSLQQTEPFVPVGPPFDQIVAGGRRVCVISGSKGACWGANDYGQITGTPMPTLPPTPVTLFGLQ